MATYYTNIVDGEAVSAAVVNGKIAPLDTKVVDHETRVTVAEATIFNHATRLDSDEGELDLISPPVTAGLNTDGTVKANKVVAGSIATGGVSASTQLAAGVVTGDRINSAALAPVNFMRDPFNQVLPAGTNDGSVRWRVDLSGNQSGATITDSSNPYGAPTIRMLGSSTEPRVGKRQTIAESGVRVGDAINGAIECKAASGTFRARWFYYSSSTTFTAAAGTTTTFSGSTQTLTVSGTIPASTIAIELILERVSGTADADVYAWHGTRGTYPVTQIAPSPTAISTQAAPNIVFDPYNVNTTPGNGWDEHPRWWGPDGLSIVTPDASNPFQGRTLRFANGSTLNYGGKIIPLKEAGLAIGDTVTAAAWVSAASGTFRIRLIALDSAGDTYVGSGVFTISPTMDGTPKRITTPAYTIPATASYIVVWFSRETATVDLDIYAMWANVGSTVSMLPAQDSAATFANMRAMNPLSNGMYGLHHLASWRKGVSNVRRATAGANVVMIGDSWVERVDIPVPLRALLQTIGNDPGNGYIGVGNNRGNSNKPTTGQTWTYVRSGTWTSTDQSASSKGVDITDTTTVDTSTPASIVITPTTPTNSFVIHYLKKSGGGSFRYRIDAGSWTTVATSNASDLYSTVTVSTSATSVLTIEALTAGSTGVTLFGVEANRTDAGYGIRLHNLGNSSSWTAQWVAVDATLWQAAVTALAPSVAIILLGTNDKSQNINPITYATQLTTLIGRIRTAVPRCAVLLVAPAESGVAASFKSRRYVDAMYGVAVREDCAFLSLMHTMYGSYTDANADGIMTDTLHFNALGGDMAACDIARALQVEEVDEASDVTAQLREWTTSEAYELLSITRNANGVVTTATVRWPDASTGTYTSTTINSTWNAVDAYTITHVMSGKTVTQTAVTRDANGGITTKPALTVA